MTPLPPSASLDNFAFKLLGAPPFADALEAVAVAAVGENSEAPFAGVGLLKHHLHAHSAHHVLAALDGKGDLHVLLMGFDAGLRERQRETEGEREEVCEIARKTHFNHPETGKSFYASFWNFILLFYS